jgi:hydroxymethylpyrimidine pyrophosphatase-like HAD family hydrolase
MDRIIFFDWDNTIVPANYQLDDEEFKLLIHKRQKEGWLIGLNSDTPYKRLHKWQRSLGMNGPIVAERGAVIWWNDELIQVSKANVIFTNLRQNAIIEFSQRLDTSLFVGDSTEFIKSVRQVKSSDSILIAIDSYRMCSLGVFVRKIADDGTLRISSETTQSIADILTRLIVEDPLVSPMDLSGIPYGFINFSPTDANKSLGVQALIKKWHNISEIVMVGDSINDYISLSLPFPKIRHFAVSNASSEYKSKSEYVSSKGYVYGCNEILKKLAG